MFALLVLRTGREGLQDDTTGRLADLGAQVSVRAPMKEENQRATAGGGQQEKEMKARRMQAPVASSAKTAKQGRGAGARGQTNVLAVRGRRNPPAPTPSVL